MKLVFASNNTHKMQEIRSLLPESYELLSLYDIACKDDPPETGSTMEENALEKALFVFDRYGLACFADDSGLEVEALNGAPGIYSARYAGPERDMVKNMAKLVSAMEGVANRKARFRTVIAYVTGNGHRLFEGVISGKILEKPAGNGGFGYDPLFVPDGYKVSFAEMSHDEKNRISHRGRALILLINHLENETGSQVQPLNHNQ